MIQRLIVIFFMAVVLIAVLGKWCWLILGLVVLYYCIRFLADWYWSMKDKGMLQ
jgi:hypothetical protein